MLHDLFSARAIVHAEKTAVVADDARLSYARLEAESLRLARALRCAGATTGDRVAMIIPNSAQAAVTVWAVWRAGCILVPMHAGARAPALDAVLADSEPRYIIAGAESAAVVASAPYITRAERIVLWSSKQTTNTKLPAERTLEWTLEGSSTQKMCADGLAGGGREGETASLIYTSGSTGEPKGVTLTHANMLAAVKAVNAYLRWDSSDVIYSALPLSSSYGLYQLVSGLAVGATVVIDRSFAFPTRSLALAARERATVFAGVPTMYAWLASSGARQANDLACLRMLTSAAASLPVEHGRRIRQMFPGAKLFVMYGQTECKRISYLDPDDFERKPGSVGCGIPYQEHAIVDEAGEAVAVGEIGELVVRGPHVMQGYWRKNEQTARKLRPIGGSADTWLHTDDLFRGDEDGYLYFMGRRDDLLKVGGHKVSPRDVEDVLCRMPQVREAAVIGTPDPTWGVVPRAYVVPRDDQRLSPEDVIRFCSSHLPGFMVPRSVVLVADLPKTESGKVRKRDLAQARELHPGPGGGPSADA